MANGNNLTIRQRRFVEAMIDPATKTQTAAAIKAGFSEKTADSKASQLVRHSKVARELEARRYQRWDKARENVHKALERQSQALDAVDPHDNPLEATQVSALTIKSSGEYVEKFSDSAQEQGPSDVEKLLLKRKLRRYILAGALRSSPTFIETTRRKLEELDDLISRIRG